MWDALAGTTWGGLEAWRVVGLLALFDVIFWVCAIYIGGRPAQIAADPRFVILMVLALADTGIIILAVIAWVLGALMTKM